MSNLDQIYEEIKEKYKEEITIQDNLYNITNAQETLNYFNDFFERNIDFLKDAKQLISFAHQLTFSTLYRPKHIKLYSQIANILNTIRIQSISQDLKGEESNPTQNSNFSDILFGTITKYLLNIKCFPEISPLIYFMRRIFEQNMINIERIISFMHSIQSNNDYREIIFLFFVVFAPDLENYDIDSYDIFYNIIEEFSFAQTSDDEYQVGEDGYAYSPFRSFTTRFFKFQNDNEFDSNFENESEIDEEKDKWEELKKCVEEESDSRFPLLKAIKHDDVDCLQTIISRNPDFDINQKVPQTVFETNPYANKNCFLIEYCCIFGSIKCFKFLLLQHVRFPFMCHIPAIIGGNVEIVHILEQQRMEDLKQNKLNEINIYGNNFFPESLHYSALLHQNSIFEWLVDSKGKNLDELDFNGKTVIGYAAKSNNIELLIDILQKDVDINLPDENLIKKTALIHACENGCYEVCQILLSRKSTQINFENYSPIHAALSNSHFHIIRLLCERDDIDFNVMDENGSTPLHIAIMNEDIETVKMLILSKNKNQVNINKMNKIFFNGLIGFYTHIY